MIRDIVTTIFQVLYSASAIGLAVVGFNTLLLSILYLVHRRDSTPDPDTPADDAWPDVVVQLPIYNEKHVVDDLIEAVAGLDYPRDRLRIQVLDDSTDETVHHAATAIERQRVHGVDITHVRRANREGYKAGALAVGLAESEAPFVAVFDADFTPDADFLRRTIPYFVADDRLGMVQARWAHRNADHSALTQAQALALDAHFVVEQTARHRSGLLMNFSGTAGVWRRECIVDAGGWHHDTLSEDIDLSYRAQLRGWRFLYLPDVGAPAEIPPLMMGFKRQQSRWATGTIQCLRKLGSTLVRSELGIWAKLEGLLHLGGYLLHPLMLVLLLSTLPLLLLNGISSLPLAGLGFAMLGSPLQASISQTRLYDDWQKRLVYFPVFMLLGVGITVSNTVAVLRAFSSRPLSFRRTPKFQAVDDASGWLSSVYTLPVDATTWIELGLALYAALTAVIAVTRLPALTPFMALYAGGFGFVALTSLLQSRRARRARTQHSDQLFGLSGS